MAQNVTLSPTALTFCVASTSSAAPAAQTVSVSTTNTQGVFYTTATTDSNWLHVSPASGTATSSTPGSLSVSITPAGLPSNTPPAQDVQVDVGGQETNVVVTVEVGQSGCVPTQGAALSASPTSIALTSSTTSASLTINGSGSVNYTASGGFFTINSSSATTGSITLPLSSALTIALSSSATTTSSYSGSITFSQGSSFVTVPVSYTGSGGGSGSFSVNTTSLNLSSGSQTLTVSGSGSVSVSSSGGSTANWFSVNGTGLTLSEGTITLPETITVSLTNGIAVTTQDYSGTITLTQGSSVINVAVVYKGSNLISASPTSIALTSSANAENFTISGTGSVTMQANFGPSPNPSGWFSIVGYSGASVPLSPSAQFTVAFNANVASANASYSGGTVQITQGSTTLSVPVSYTPTGGVSGTYSYSPTPVFNIATGATSVSPITVNVGGFNGLVVSVLTQINNGPSGWLSAGDNSFESPTQVTVSINNPSSLSGGQTYTGSVYLQENGVTLLTIPVTVNVGSSASTLTVSPTSLSFSYQIGGTTPGSQSINISSPASTQILFTPSASTDNCGNGWLVVSPSYQTSTSGTTPVSVSVQINTAGLGSTSETCNGNVTISAPSATNSTINIPVSLLVSNTPLLQAAPASLTFTAQSVANLPASQTVSLTSTGGALPFSYTVNPSSTGGTVFLTVTPSTTTTPSTLTAAINAAVFSSLTPGTYTNNIVLTSANAGNSPFTIPVTLTVGTSLNASPSAIVINYQVGELQPAAQTILVSSTGAPIQFTASVVNQTCSNLVQVTPTIGTTTQSLGQNGTALTVETSNLSSFFNPTTCTAAIDIVASTSSTPVVVNVTVNIVSAAVIDVGVSEVIQAANAILPSSQIATVPLTTSDDGLTKINFSATAATHPAGQTWLTVSPNSGSTPSNLQVTTNSTNLSPGTYTGSITITSATDVPTETVPVTLIVASQATVSPTSLTFTLPQGASNPATQTITVGGVPASTSITAVPTTASCGTGWLTATASGTTVTVGIAGAGLTVATCTGQVTVIVQGASNSPLNVPVTLSVTNAIALSLSSTSLTFMSNTGAATAPASQTVQLSAAGGAAISYTTAAATQSGGNWLTVSPASGTTPGTLTIGIAQSVLAGLSAGTYSGTVTVSSPNSANVTVAVTLTVTAVPPPAPVSIVNSATQLPGAVSPGEIVTLYGTNLGPTPALGLTLTSGGTVETTLGTTQVFFDSTPAPLIYVGANQINAIVPYEVAGRSQTTITVSTNGLVSSGIIQSVVATAPGIFTANSSGKGPGAILNQDYSVNSASNPAAAGSVVSIYATGEGVLNPPVATGTVTSKNPPYPVPVASPVSVTFQVTSNGKTVNIPANVTYAGEAPELVSGALQVNVVIPTLVPSGAQTVILTIGTNSSPAQVTVNVK